MKSIAFISINIFCFTFFFIISICSSYGQKTYRLEESVYLLTNYIASEKFSNYKKSLDPISLIDTMYLKATEIYGNDKSEALLSLTFATLSFREMPLKLPLGIELKLSLPSTHKTLFEKKNENLPSHFLIDSPPGVNSDKDKLAHFFGNAFLSYNVSFIHLSDFLGMFVETFEATFSVSEIDKRDLAINKFGSDFGMALRDKPNLMPSDFLKMYNLFIILRK